MSCIWIRADGNEKIASGHLMRTLSIARELEKRGCAVQYLLADEVSLAWLRRMEELQEGDGGCDRDTAGIRTADRETQAREAECTEDSERRLPAVILGVPYGNPEAELPLLWDLLQKAGHRSETETTQKPPQEENIGFLLRPDWILVDSYAVSESWLRQLGEMGVRVAYMDDEQQFLPPTALAVNYDPGAEPACRAAEKRNGRYLCGPAYAPLRPQFADLRPLVRARVGRIFLSTGGTDPHQLAGDLERLVRELGYEAVVMAPGYPRIVRAAEAMQSCDLAVAAAGTTLYELCAAGVPTLAYAMADNQALFARAMEKAGAVHYLGEIREAGALREYMPAIRQWLAERCAAGSGYSLRCRESVRMHELTDGKGAGRIAEALLQDR